MKQELDEKLARNMKGFVFVFRFLALLLGFFLTKFGTCGNISPIPEPLNNPIVFISVFLFFEIATAIFAHKFSEHKFDIYMLLAADIGIGVFLTYFYGTSYFFLAVVFPIFEAYYYFSIGRFLFTLIALAAVYVPLFGYLIAGLQRRPDVFERMMGEFEIYLLTAFALIFLYSIGVKNTGAGKEIKEKQEKEKKSLLEEVDRLKKEMKELFNELDYRYETIEELQKELTASRIGLEEKKKEAEEIKDKGKQLLDIAQKKEEKTAKELFAENDKLKEKIQLLSIKIHKHREIFNIFQKINFSTNLGRTYINIVESVQKILPSQTTVFFTVDKLKEQKKIFPEVLATPYEDYFKNLSFNFEEGIVGQAAYLNTPIKIDDGETVFDGKNINSLIAYEKSAIAAPLVFEGELHGVIYLGRVKSNAFDEGDIEKLSLFCSLIGTALKFVYNFYHAITSRITDSLTGLYNDFYFKERLEEEAKRAQRYNLSVGLLLIDIDNFSKINENFGMPVGDEVIKEVASLIKKQTRESDCIAYLGNDEFGIILVQTDKNASILIAERIRMALGLRCFAKNFGKNINLSVSIGVATLPADTKDINSLMRIAKISLNSAKSRGGDTAFFKM